MRNTAHIQTVDMSALVQGVNERRAEERQAVLNEQRENFRKYLERERMGKYLQQDIDNLIANAKKKMEQKQNLKQQGMIPPFPKPKRLVIYVSLDSSLQGVRIKSGRGGTKILGKIYPVYLVIPPKKGGCDFAIPPI